MHYIRTTKGGKNICVEVLWQVCGNLPAMRHFLSTWTHTCDWFFLPFLRSACMVIYPSRLEFGEGFLRRESSFIVVIWRPSLEVWTLLDSLIREKKKYRPKIFDHTLKISYLFSFCLGLNQLVENNARRRAIILYLWKKRDAHENWAKHRTNG